MAKMEKILEKLLWNSRFVVLSAVAASMAACIAIFYMATVDVFYMVTHILHYADPSLDAAARKLMHDESVAHIVSAMDGFLLATVMLIFSLGLYELFISEIDEAKGSKTGGKILLIESLDDLKSRLAKVILMILIVSLFENAVKLKFEVALDMLYFGGTIALVGLALYLTHAAEPKGGKEH